MKLWTIICVAIAGLLFANTLVATENDTSKPVNVKSISYTIDEQENVTFQLSAPMTPKVFSIKGDNPRIVIDLPGAWYAGPRVAIPDGAVMAAKLRIELHEEPARKTRVVLDLNPAKNVDYKVESEGETIKIVLSGSDKELQAESAEPAPPAVAKAVAPEKPEAAPVELPKPEPEQAAVEKMPAGDDSVVIQPAVPAAPTVPAVPAEESREDLAAKPLDQKPVPPVFAVKKDQAKQKKQKQATAGVTAQLQKISFDDSSEKGEMVLFHLNDFYPPSVTAVETDNPGVICEFAAMSVADSVDKTIYTNGKFVERIRTEIQQDTGKVKVFLDLAPNYDYDLQQVFFKTDNLFVLIINELSAGKKNDPPGK